MCLSGDVPNSRRAVLQAVAAAKAASLALAVAYLWFPARLLSDAAAVAFVAAHWTLSGLVGAWSYMLLPQALPHPDSAAHGGNAMSAAFQLSQMLGLAAAAVLEYIALASGVAGAPG